MKSFEPQVELLEYILSGDAVLWVGAGASAEMGYPSWRDQAMAAKDAFERAGVAYDKEGFDKFYRDCDYAAAFSALANAVGKKRLLEELRRVTKPDSVGTDSIYNTITKWPVNAFVTTNFDDEIARHLERNRPNERYTTVGNSDADIALLGDEMHHLIFKVHGNLNDVKNSVVTTQDYHEFSAVKSNYQRALIRLFKNKKVIIIGYSLGDKDVQLALETASKYGRPSAPIYLILSDVTKTEADIKKNIYNVRIIPYENKDERHAQLGKILASYDLFVSVKQKGMHASKDARDAVPLFLFRNLNKTARTVDANNYVLMKIPSCKDRPIVLGKIKELVGVPRIDAQKAIEALCNDKLVQQVDQRYARTAQGDERVEEVKNQSMGIEKVAYENFLQAFETTLTTEQTELLMECARMCIEEIFERQGLELLHSIYHEQEFDGCSMRDMYEIIADACQSIKNVDLKLSFIRSMRMFVAAPSPSQRKYLASLSQGYLMFHMMGRSENCAAELKRIAEKDVWYVDSNVLQPFFAKGCPEFGLAEQVVALIRKHHLKCKTTQNVLKEVQDHLTWAKRHIPSIEEFKAVANIPENDARYNFFVAGYVHMMLTKKIECFDEYLETIGANDANWIASRLEGCGICVEGNGSDKAFCDVYNKACADITFIRKDNGSLSDNPLQVSTDAELYAHMVNEKAQMDQTHDDGDAKVMFLSTSGLFSATEIRFPNWSMARFIRYMSLLSERWTSIDTLSDCMRSELCCCGLVIVNESNLDEYFDPAIRTANLNLRREKKRLGKMLYDISGMTEEQLDKKVACMPKYMLPEFTGQLIAHVNGQALYETRTENDKLRAENEALAKKIELLEKKYDEVLKGRNGVATKASRLNRKKNAEKNREKKQACRNKRR